MPPPYKDYAECDPFLAQMAEAQEQASEIHEAFAQMQEKLEQLYEEEASLENEFTGGVNDDAGMGFLADIFAELLILQHERESVEQQIEYLREGLEAVEAAYEAAKEAYEECMCGSEQ